MSKLTPTDWQLEDLEYLKPRVSTANWSQMGCYKTSTALWLTEAKTQEVTNPSVLIVTTRSGKGSYFRDIPKCLTDEWQIFNVRVDGVFLVIEGMEVKVGATLPSVINFPHIVVTHYHLFSKSHLKKKEKCSACSGWGKVDMEMCYICEGKGKVPLPWKPCDYLIDRQWDMAILDEAHRIKNPEAKWTVNLKKIKAHNKHIMTGSGFVNRPDEIWSLLNFLSPTTYKSYWNFRNDYCETDPWSGYNTVVGLKKHMVPAFRRIRKSFGPRRTKPEVFPDLTEPIYEDLEVDLNPTQQRMYNEIVSELRALDEKGVPLHSPNVLSQLQRLRQISVATPEVLDDYFDDAHQRRVVEIRLTEPSSKLDALMEVIDGLQWDDEDKQQIVVFSNFNDPLDLLQTRLNKANIGWIRLRQKDNDQERYQKWYHEFPQKKAQVFMSTIKLGGESISLTSAQYVAFLDMDWAPANNDQAIERVWRPGYDTSQGAPIVIRLFATGTVDYRILNMNEDKRAWFTEIFGSKTNEQEPLDFASMI